MMPFPELIGHPVDGLSIASQGSIERRFDDLLRIFDLQQIGYAHTITRCSAGISEFDNLNSVPLLPSPDAAGLEVVDGSVAFLFGQNLAVNIEVVAVRSLSSSVLAVLIVFFFHFSHSKYCVDARRLDISRNNIITSVCYVCND